LTYYYNVSVNCFLDAISSIFAFALKLLLALLALQHLLSQMLLFKLFIILVFTCLHMCHFL